MPGPSLGINLSGLADWNTAFPFLNLFQMSRPWYTQTDSQFDTGQAGLLDLDANGWVRGFTADGSAAPFDRVATILNTGGVAPRPGVYVLDWQGEGTIELSHGSNVRVLSQEEGRITLRIDGPGEMQIAIAATDPQHSGNYLRDIRLYHQQDAALLQAGQVFTPEFLDRIGAFRSLRFMDWMDTNGSQVHGAGDLRPEDAARQTGPGGASVEVMVALANETRADPWFNIPVHASNEWVRSFATYVRDHLAEGLVARFEFSNEVWNWGFEQAHFAQSRAEALWGADVEGGWMQWYGMRAAAVARQVAAVFGDETGTRALNVFSTQAGWQGLEHYALDAPALVAQGGSAPRNAPFHVYAIAPYFGGSIGGPDMAAQVDRWIAQGADGFRHALAWLRSGDAADTLAHIGETIAYHAAVAQSLGWQLEAYEGGQHVVDVTWVDGSRDPAHTAFFIELVRQPEFFGLYLRYFEIWQAQGGGLMDSFSDFGPPSEWGSWGIWDSLWAEDSPRARAVERFRDTVAAWWEDARTDADFATGRVRVDRDGTGHLAGTALGDALFGLGGDDALAGGRGADLLQGGRGRDSLAGGAGDDDLRGDAGDDSLIGGPGQDVLDGGAGSDRLDGGAGDDVMRGGAGADSFLFRAGSGADSIRRFAPQDRLVLTHDLTDGLTAPDAIAARFGHAEGDDYVFAFATGDSLRLVEVGAGFDPTGVILVV